ncbi:hypothetical protein JI721_02830 [Alicyclobacillus cycloheptanicus]|uniref:Uncharacterized protein n=1 Tax=Alicyclobacillus cycloheptanicus TaxID=1457 RepID=A0ABT9XK50_9BACL|nr:hypothetical protein [Alicyclobacillus cycloheptanicus]MDQ0190592.1 hypothetical protein [Alicyclobacillus cycloheptanicus]WDM01799.1 hypothetical protein JI721_02830 [Alicyclobacillus cycloheptanicus]
MRRFFLIVFVIALIIVGIETFKPQAPFPSVDGAGAYVTGQVLASGSGN